MGTSHMGGTMILTRNEPFEDELLQEMYQAMFDPDRIQPSVTGMIYCLTKTYWNNTLTATGLPPASRRTLLLMATGLGLEKVMLSGRQNATLGVTDGISWHTDHVGSSKDDFIEFKSTRISTKRADPLSKGWKKQILAYFKAENLTSGKVVLLHILGPDGGGAPFPDIRAYDIQSTQDEVDTNWQWILNRASIYAEAISTQTPPTPFVYNMDWECKECVWLEVCKSNSKLPSLTGSSREL